MADEFDVMGGLKSQDRLREEAKKLTERLLVRAAVLGGASKAADDASLTPEARKKFTLKFGTKEGSGVGLGKGKDEKNSGDGSRLLVLHEEVYQACLEALDAKPGALVREGPVEVLKSNGRMQKRWMKISTTHVEILEAQDSKTPVKSFPLIGLLPERAPPKSQGQHLLELITPSSKPVIVNIADNCNSYLLTMLQVRVVAIKKLFDTCQPFRNFMLAGKKSVHPSKQTGTIGASSGIGGGGGGANAELFKFAFLEYERVGASYAIASHMHETYMADVERILARLEIATQSRERLWREIASMETELGNAQRDTLAAGRKLSETFGMVLHSVSTLHRSLTATHKELKEEAEAGRAGDKEKLLAFRQGLNMLDSGLMMDGPLKKQLETLEKSDSRSVSELAALQARKDQLGLDLEDARNKKQALGDVMARAGLLNSVLGQAASIAGDGESTEGADPRPWVQQCAGQLPAEKGASALHLESVLGAVGNGPVVAAPAAASSRGKTVVNSKAAMLLGATDVFSTVMSGDEEAPGHEDADASGSTGANAPAADDTPNALVQRVLTRPSGNLETVLLRTFTYFMKPVQLWEHINMTYCAGPSFQNSTGEAADIEKKMAGVRFRTLNVLKKWVELQKYHFTDDQQMLRLIGNFLSTVRLVGHEKIATMIEQELLTGSEGGKEKEKQLMYAPPLFKDGFEKVETIAILSHVLSEELARQMTLLDQSLYRKLQVREFLKLNFMKKPELAPNIRAFTAHFNVVAACVTSSILAVPALAERTKVVHFWIKVLEHLRTLKNYESTLAVVAGMTTTPVNRLKNTWAGLPPEANAYFEDCRNLMEKNFARLRLELDTATPPAIPYLGAYQRDLVYLDESPTMKGDAVNISKLKAISSVLQNCLAFQESQYWFQEVPEIQRLITHMPTFSDEEAHATSLKLEPRVVEPHPDDSSASGGMSSAAAKDRKSSAAGTAGGAGAGGASGSGAAGSIRAGKGTVVNKFANMKDEDLPRLPTFPPPLTDKEDYKEYMQLRYEYKRRHIPLDGAVAFVNVSTTNEGGGFLKIKNELEEEDITDEDDPEDKPEKRLIVAPPLQKNDSSSGIPSVAPRSGSLHSSQGAVSRISTSNRISDAGPELPAMPAVPSLPALPAEEPNKPRSNFGVAPSQAPKLSVPMTGSHRRQGSDSAPADSSGELKKIPLSPGRGRRVAVGNSGMQLEERKSVRVSAGSGEVEDEDKSPGRAPPMTTSAASSATTLARDSGAKKALPPLPPAKNN